MLETIVIILLVLWLIGYAPADATYRSWGGGYGYHGVGAVLVVLIVLALLHVI